MASQARERYHEQRCPDCPSRQGSRRLRDRGVSATSATGCYAHKLSCVADVREVRGEVSRRSELRTPAQPPASGETRQTDALPTQPTQPDRPIKGDMDAPIPRLWIGTARNLRSLGVIAAWRCRDADVNGARGEAADSLWHCGFAKPLTGSESRRTHDVHPETMTRCQPNQKPLPLRAMHRGPSSPCLLGGVFILDWKVRHQLPH